MGAGGYSYWLQLDQLLTPAINSTYRSGLSAVDHTQSIRRILTCSQAHHCVTFLFNFPIFGLTVI